MHEFVDRVAREIEIANDIDQLIEIATASSLTMGKREAWLADQPPLLQSSEDRNLD
jgi:hypothetical protein